MFTIKLYSLDGFRQRILSAESFTILRANKLGDRDPDAEITLHQKNPGDDVRYDIGNEIERTGDQLYWPQRYAKAIIENAAGRTTEIVGMLGPK